MMGLGLIIQILIKLKASPIVIVSKLEFDNLNLKLLNFIMFLNIKRGE